MADLLSAERRLAEIDAMLARPTEVLDDHSFNEYIGACFDLRALLKSVEGERDIAQKISARRHSRGVRLTTALTALQEKCVLAEEARRGFKLALSAIQENLAAAEHRASVAVGALKDALKFIESEMHYSQPTHDSGEEPSNQFTYDAIPICVGLRNALATLTKEGQP